MIKKGDISKKALLGLVKEHWVFIALCAVFLGTIILLASTWFRYYIYPDTTSYFTIAYKYAHLDIGSAINGYWGPLLSWLLVPAIWIHADPVIASKTLGGLIGVSILAMLYVFFLKKGVAKHISLFSVFAAAITLTQLITIGPITPDLLLAGLILLFVIRLASFLDKPTTKNGILIGLIGAFMFFSKGFGFYLFLAIVGLLALWQLWTKDDWKLALTSKRYMPVVLTFFILVLPFIGALSVKYHKLTINNAGRYDHHVFGPVAKNVQPIINVGPLAPPNDSASTIWEDPSSTTDLIPGWSPLESREYFNYFMGSVFGRNLNYTLLYLYGFGALTVIGLFIAYIGAFRKDAYQKYYALSALVFTLLALGYSVVLTEPRYLWCAILFAITSATLWISTLNKKKIIISPQLIAAALIITTIMALNVGQQIALSHKGEGKDWKIAHLRAASLKKIVPKDSKAISDSFSNYYTCYYLDLRCYGVLQTPEPGDEVRYTKQVQSAGVTYFMDTHRRDDDKRFKAYIDAYFTKVGETTVGGKKDKTKTTVYKIKQPVTRQ